MAAQSRLRSFTARAATQALLNWGPQLAQNEAVRRRIVRRVERALLAEREQARADPNGIPGVADDRMAVGLAILGTIERALVEDLLSPASVRGIIKLLVQSLFIEQGDQSAAGNFRRQYGMRAPTFLTISPGKACNLRCTGCYADSGDVAQALDWGLVDRIIAEAKSLWGARFFVFSGGEPFAYRSAGKGILELVEKHADCLFMTYTNGTLINSEVSKRLALAGNMLPAISVEGWKERTDARRGEGVFDKVLAAMSLLRKDGVPFGISLTATRHNAEEILSEEFIDFFQRQGALFGWLFQYMPIGRSFSLDLLPTPQQRLWMWRRSWEIVRNRRMFLADFWNSGTACDGCLSAGGHGAGGYFYIDWNGAVSPCVFVPYSPVNIKEVYARGGTLNDVWADPFFRSLREWQLYYKKKQGNGLAPCPTRDHHAELQQLLIQHEPGPLDAHAAAVLADPAYACGLAQYGATYQAMTQELWESQYLRGTTAEDNDMKTPPAVTRLS